MYIVIYLFHAKKINTIFDRLIDNLKIYKALLKSQAHQGTSLFTSAATNQGGSQRMVKRNSGAISEGREGDSVPVNMGVVVLIELASYNIVYYTVLHVHAGVRVIH